MKLRKRGGQDDEDERPIVSFASKYKHLDLFPKLEEDVIQSGGGNVKTSFGGFTFVLTMFLLGILFLGEFSSYLFAEPTHSLRVDTEGRKRLNIYYNISFPALQCSDLHLDVVDTFGEMHLHQALNNYKMRISPDGVPLNVPYEGEENAQEDQQGEGCVVWGHVAVNKVKGNFHWALGASSRKNIQQHVHTFNMNKALTFNASHIIHQLSFGEEFAGILTPLRGIVGTSPTFIAHWAYEIKVIPTNYHRYGEVLHTNQYSYTDDMVLVPPGSPLTEHNIPGVFFNYDLSPFLIDVGQDDVPFSRFLVSICAILGGVFTVSGLIDSIVYRGSKILGINLK